MDGKCQLLALLEALLLVRSGGAQRGVKGQVVRFAIRRARLDITPTLALGAGARAFAALAAGDAVDRVLDFARGEDLANLDFLAAFPPVGADGIEYLLLGWFGRGVLRFLGLDLSR